MKEEEFFSLSINSIKEKLKRYGRIVGKGLYEKAKNLYRDFDALAGKDTLFLWEKTYFINIEFQIRENNPKYINWSNLFALRLNKKGFSKLIKNTTVDKNNFINAIIFDVSKLVKIDVSHWIEIKGKVKEEFDAVIKKVSVMIDGTITFFIDYENEEIFVKILLDLKDPNLDEFRDSLLDKLISLIDESIDELEIIFN